MATFVRTNVPDVKQDFYTFYGFKGNKQQSKFW